MKIEEERKNWNTVIELTKALRRRGYNEISYRRFGGVLGVVFKTYDFDGFDARRLEKTMRALDHNNRLLWAIDCGDWEGLKIRVKMWVLND